MLNSLQLCILLIGNGWNLKNFSIRGDSFTFETLKSDLWMKSMVKTMNQFGFWEKWQNFYVFQIETDMESSFIALKLIFFFRLKITFREINRSLSNYIIFGLCIFSSSFLFVCGPRLKTVWGFCVFFSLEKRNRWMSTQMGPTPANSLFIQNNCSRFPVQRTSTEENEMKNGTPTVVSRRS